MGSGEDVASEQRAHQSPQRAAGCADPGARRWREGWRGLGEVLPFPFCIFSSATLRDSSDGLVGVDVPLLKLIQVGSSPLPESFALNFKLLRPQESPLKPELKLAELLGPRPNLHRSRASPLRLPWVGFQNMTSGRAWSLQDVALGRCWPPVMDTNCGFGFLIVETVCNKISKAINCFFMR